MITLGRLIKWRNNRGVVEPATVRWVVSLYVLLLAINALDAYDLGRIPFQWIMQVGSIAGATYIAFRYPLPQPLGRRFLWLFLAWSTSITVVNSLVNNYALLMPSGATTPYALFITLRLVTLASFIASLYFAYWLLVHGARERVVMSTIILGTLASIFAIYFYVAQLYGLPEFPRNRLGTGGGFQAIRFTYDFHRAIGTFREPSLLAAWLIVPFFLAIEMGGRASYIQAIVMGGAILLTGSLSGIMALVIGLAVVTSIAAVSGVGLGRNLIRALAVVPFALAIFYLLASSNTGHGVNLFSTLGGRLWTVIGAGIGHSDRAPIYDFVGHTSPPVLGVGLGNANLLLTHYFGTTVIAGFISLYLNSLYATGLIGLTLLGCFLLTPAFTVATDPVLRRSRKVLVLMAPYLAWLVIFGVSVEELTFMFGVAFAMLSSAIQHDNPVGPAASGVSPSGGGAIPDESEKTRGANIHLP